MSVNLSFAQTTLIKGKISEASGEALYGVSVKVKGSNQGSTSNEKGEYAINAKEGATLVLVM